VNTAPGFDYHAQPPGTVFTGPLLPTTPDPAAAAFAASQNANSSSGSSGGGGGSSSGGVGSGGGVGSTIPPSIPSSIPPSLDRWLREGDERPGLGVVLVCLGRLGRPGPAVLRGLLDALSPALSAPPASPVRSASAAAAGLSGDPDPRFPRVLWLVAPDQRDDLVAAMGTSVAFEHLTQAHQQTHPAVVVAQQQQTVSGGRGVPPLAGSSSSGMAFPVVATSIPVPLPPHIRVKVG